MKQPPHNPGTVRDDRSRATLAYWWNDARVRGVISQLLVVSVIAFIIWYLASNTVANLEARNIASGFGFLDREAGFDVSESSIAYSAADTYKRVFLVGIINTLKVSLIGIVLATLIGTVAGIARLSTNWLVAKFATVYVEGLRNVPVLLQLFFWYALITEGLPHPRQALNLLPGVFLSNRGLMYPEPVWHPAFALMAAAFVLAVAATWLIGRWARKRQERTGQPYPVVGVGLALIVCSMALAYIVGGAPTALDVPELKGFNFQGGGTITPEFTALLVGLIMYTGTYIAEIVRGGILAVAHGQTEAGLALGLKRSLVLRFILLPQALRVIIPPLTSQYLNLTKNSSLAVAIGFPDLVAVANTSVNQTGQAVE
ncbi:MAG: ABC transporter permease subunit, partial [Rhodospirillales bacterium]|nr:ABC transporter permease subunit [Rhodospirillales bacterium]